MDIREHYDKIFKYCSSRISSRETAEDITQETFLRFLEHPEYQGKHALQYLYTIARNLCVDTYRKQPEEELPEEIPDTHSGESEWIDRIALRTVLDRLPPEDREIIVLRYVSELSVADIARIHGVSWFVMNRRIKSVLAELRNAFGKEGEH
ncbi:MAG: RNA polymerase sigma factor [Oscillospiraceae bacterium]|nr:RNA polymerase sigma factor [Oscillospiraceae bacterium]